MSGRRERARASGCLVFVLLSRAHRLDHALDDALLPFGRAVVPRRKVWSSILVYGQGGTGSRIKERLSMEAAKTVGGRYYGVCVILG
eukprot:6211111-Pleurochrysis_carterae.AAC.1